jgi:hypothetical protein
VREATSLSVPRPPLAPLAEGGGFFNSVVGRLPPIGYRHLDDAPPTREGPQEIKRSESPPPPSPSGPDDQIDHWYQKISLCRLRSAVLVVGTDLGRGCRARCLPSLPPSRPSQGKVDHLTVEGAKPLHNVRAGHRGWGSGCGVRDRVPAGAVDCLQHRNKLQKDMGNALRSVAPYVVALVVGWLLGARSSSSSAGPGGAGKAPAAPGQ